MTQTALILDGRAISSLSIARRLRERGMTVHSGEEFKHNITAYSGATAKAHKYPSPDEKPAAFKRSVARLIEREAFDFVLPVRDSTTRLIAELVDELPAATNTLLDSPAKIERLQDKEQFAKLAVARDVPVPKTYFPDEQGLGYIQRRAAFPVLIKPTNASGARGIRRVETPAELPGTYREATRGGEDVIVQEFVDHAGGHYSIGTVFDRTGTPRAIHAYEELIQYPDGAGPAIRARSVEIEPWVHEMLELLKAIGWTGPAHMDVLFDPDEQTYKLLEVNPRIWSSIALAIGSGVDIPGVVVDLASGADVETTSAYRTDQIYRWVLPNEILWALDGWNTPARIGRLLKRDGDAITYSILSRDDPGAVVGTALQSARFLLDAEKRKQIFGRGWGSETEESRERRTSTRRRERQHLSKQKHE